MNLLVILFITLIKCSKSDNLTQEMQYKEGTSVEFKYTLPVVNLSVGGNEIVVTSRLARMLDFFNTELLVANWYRIRGLVTKSCRHDIGLYIGGLSKGDNWALKMDDANGRYSTGWFWGNHYWTGSQSLCENISPKNTLSTNPENHSRLSRDVKISRKLTPSQAIGYNSNFLQYTLSPFPIAFFMTRIHLNFSFTLDERILHVGYCMPYMCTDDDIKVLIEETSKISKGISVIVEAVRSPHNYFDIWQDRTFRILCVITSLVIVMLVIGTCFDFYLEYCEKKLKMMASNQIKLDMTMPDTKTKNGLVLKESVLAFSLRSNIRTICDKSVSSDTIPVIHGLKSISMAWVILGHTCIVAFKYSDNMEYRKVVQQDFFFQTISNGAFSVDTFFFTSGLLVSFLYFRTNAKGKLDSLTSGHGGLIGGVNHFLGLIFYRFIRLTAPYLFTLGVVEVVMKWFNYNSVFEPPTMDHVNCPNYWWRNVLYINTLFPVEEMCMLWSWYLSDDTQFYVIGAIMLILATRHFKSAAALLIIFMISSWLTTGYIAFSNSHMPGSDDPLALFDKIYDKPWTRLGPYLIGMCVGWFLFKKNCQLPMSKTVTTIGWSASISCLFVLVYGLYEVNLSPLGGAAYSSLSHSAWALGLAWVVIACATGYGGIVNNVLSSTALYPFSRVTYCAYLLHPIVIRAMAMSMDSPLHLGTLVMIIIFLGQVMAAYGLAFFVSLAFEAPVVGMLRILSKIYVKRNHREVS